MSVEHGDAQAKKKKKKSESEKQIEKSEKRIIAESIDWHGHSGSNRQYSV